MLKSLPHWLSQQWNTSTFCICSASDEICSAQLILNYVMKWAVISPMLNMSKNWVHVGWACAKIGHLLAEPAQKLVTCWLSLRENWLFDGWVYVKIFSAHHKHFQSLYSVSPCHTFLCPLFTSLSNVICPLSHVCVPCLPSYVPCLTSLVLDSKKPN